MNILTKLNKVCEEKALYTFDYSKPMYKYQIVSTEENKDITVSMLKDTLGDYKNVLIKLITTRPHKYKDLSPNIIVASLDDILYKNVYWKNPNCQIYIFDIANNETINSTGLNELLECDCLTIIPNPSEEKDILTFTVLDNPQKTLIADYDDNLTYFGLIIEEWVNTIQVQQ